MYPPEYFVPTDGVIELVKLIASLSWFVIVYMLLYREFRYRLWVFTLITAVVTIISVSSAVATHFLMGTPRITGPFANPNLFAFYLLFAIFL
ncbi:MAG: hypothetical protein ABEI86_03095, partial [Halobacteriaceae archaeon]